ncbi:zinc-ribbon domain-containing protein [Niallia endozanthoxylica]|uniref:zinc-ribbon domain-containing protein n=1 Tax=Niallia endozanthoxylica TaxID=2036016 RepID=UPI00168B9F63|nr:zinc-ribbon domain-containing protein [Niallia endozanthoxylica]
MFCTNCGNNVDEQDKFCSSCGKEIKGRDPFKPSSTKEETINRIKNAGDKSLIQSIYIIYAIVLLVAYFIVLAMFVPTYEDNVATWLLVISTFLIDGWVLHKLKKQNIQEVFILIACTSFVSTLFFAVSTGEDAGNGLFFAMLSTFINMGIAYGSLLAIRKLEKVVKESSKKTT